MFAPAVARNLGRFADRQSFYNLAAYPQYIHELRDEIRTVLADHGGVFTNAAMQAMKKLDSFIKETMRLHPGGSASFQRKVNKPFTLSNGQVIPAGVVIEVPSGAICHDPDVFPDPNTFDPWRFSRLREQARAAGEVEAAAVNQFVSVNANVMTVRLFTPYMLFRRQKYG